MTIRGMDAEGFGAIAEALARLLEMTDDETDVALIYRIRDITRSYPPPLV